MQHWEHQNVITLNNTVCPIVFKGSSFLSNRVPQQPQRTNITKSVAERTVFEELWRMTTKIIAFKANVRFATRGATKKIPDDDLVLTKLLGPLL